MIIIIIIGIIIIIIINSAPFTIRTVVHYNICDNICVWTTISPAVARVGRSYRLRPKARVRLPVAERKRFSRCDYNSIHAIC